MLRRTGRPAYIWRGWPTTERASRCSVGCACSPVPVRPCHDAGLAKALKWCPVRARGVGGDDGFVTVLVQTVAPSSDGTTAGSPTGRRVRRVDQASHHRVAPRDHRARDDPGSPRHAVVVAGRGHTGRRYLRRGKCQHDQLLRRSRHRQGHAPHLSASARSCSCAAGRSTAIWHRSWRRCHPGSWVGRELAVGAAG